MPAFTLFQWLLAVIGSMGIGLTKSGIAGIGMLHVLIFAFLFGARDSTGVILPLLLVGDVAAVAAFRQHARRDYLLRMLPPTFVGVLVGVFVMRRLDNAEFQPVIGWIILGLVLLQTVRMAKPTLLGSVPHSRGFAWALGLLAGFTTMLANAAGSVFALYALAVGLPKMEYVGTSAWFFLLVNAFKVPFSAGLGLIHVNTLLVNLVLAPAVLAGMLFGRWLLPRLPQRIFDSLLLVFAGVASMRLILG